MPEMHFQVRWPDGAVQHCYSPSLVIHDHLTVGIDYPIEEFLTHVRTALTLASERVRAKYGFACTSAAHTLETIETAAAQALSSTESGTVRVLSMTPPSVAAVTSKGRS
ncbi:MSMEG_0570 family nitrogen starvation response protein [Nocardia sp. NPDC056100]|uniref:MSMEG_0570 family nitrogen starvation response protein n=1 Tax=Nocardia sp. NPDC056100 TaxID=3345712 RepID=UPI0035E2CAF8